MISFFSCHEKLDNPLRFYDQEQKIVKRLKFSIM